jgi:hypothetical protein
MPLKEEFLLETHVNLIREQNVSIRQFYLNHLNSENLNLNKKLKFKYFLKKLFSSLNLNFY